MPLFWSKMSSKVQFVDITSLYQDGILAIWLPDIRFHDASDINYLAQVNLFLSILYSFYRRCASIERIPFFGQDILSLQLCNQLST